MKMLLFLDIDGVLSIPNQDDLEERRVRSGWIKLPSTFPIPMHGSLLRELMMQDDLDVIWLSSWGDRSLLWNFATYTSLWKVGYHLSDTEWEEACWFFPLLAGTESRPTWRGEEVDAKLIAARYHARNHTGPIVWVEDGFARETQAWAAVHEQVHLLDTNLPEIRHALLTTPDTAEAAAAFVERYIYAGKGRDSQQSHA